MVPISEINERSTNDVTLFHLVEGLQLHLHRVVVADFKGLANKNSCLVAAVPIFNQQEGIKSDLLITQSVLLLEVEGFGGVRHHGLQHVVPIHHNPEHRRTFTQPPPCHDPPAVSPVVGVAVPVARRGVHIISDQPVEVLVASDTDVFHVPVGDVGAVCVKVPQDHHILEGQNSGSKHFTSCVVLKYCISICSSGEVCTLHLLPTSW